MNRRYRNFGPFIVLAAISFVALSPAQTQFDDFDSHCADLGILEMKPVQKEIGLTEAQRTKMNVYADAYSKRVTALRQKYASANEPPPTKALYTDYIDLKVKVLKELSPAQIKRLREISLQRIGLLALCDPKVAKRVGLSDTQVTRLKDTYSEGFKKFKTVEDGAAQEVLAPYKDRKPKTKAEADALEKEVGAKVQAAKAAIAPRLDVIKDTYDKKMRAILTAKQWETYEELRGSPFK